MNTSGKVDVSVGFTLNDYPEDKIDTLWWAFQSFIKSLREGEGFLVQRSFSVNEYGLIPIPADQEDPS